MTTTPFEVPSNLVDFKPTARSYVLHNAKNRPVSTMFVGTLMTIPPVHLLGPHSDVDADGDPIPGTYVVEDIYSDIPDPETGEDYLVFDATRAVRHILGLAPGSNGRAAFASSPFAVGGLSLLRRHSTKEEWKAVAQAGEKRAFLADVERAQLYMAHLEEVNAKRKSFNLDPIPAYGAEYERNRFILQQYGELMKKQTVETAAPHQLEGIDDDLEFDAFARAAALDLATRAAEGRNVDKVKLAEELLNDPAVRIKLQKKYQIRKRGHLPVKDELLEQAAAAGETVTGAGLEDEKPQR